MDAHAVERSFFDGELSNLFLVVISEIELNVSVRPSLAYQLDPQDLDLCGLIFFQLLLLDIAEQALFVLFQRLVIFILDEGAGTRLSMSERLTLKFWTGALVLEGSCVWVGVRDPCRYRGSCSSADAA